MRWRRCVDKDARRFGANRCVLTLGHAGWHQTKRGTRFAPVIIGHRPKAPK